MRIQLTENYEQITLSTLMFINFVYLFNFICLFIHSFVYLLRASERSERSEHTVVLSLRFLYIYIVTKILRKIRATTFTERLRKITREGLGAPGMSNATSN